MYTRDELLGSRVVSTNGGKGVVTFVFTDSNGNVIRVEIDNVCEAPVEEVRIIERQMYHSRAAKPIEEMTEEELLTYLHRLRAGRTAAMETSRNTFGMKKSRKGQPKSEKAAVKKRAKSDPTDVSALEGILSAETIAKIREGLVAKQNSQSMSL